MNRIAVVISLGQSENPARRDLEQGIVAALLAEPGIDVTVIPHLYDLPAEGTGIVALRGIRGHVIVVSWLYERAARWILDRNDVRGEVGQVQLARPDEGNGREVDRDNSAQGALAGDDRDTPARRIYCLDLRAHRAIGPFVGEVKRIARECQGESADPRHREAKDGNGTPPRDAAETALASVATVPQDKEIQRRWYPVIDYSRCTNCMECIDFCLFGVYGIDEAEMILVEQPDNCRKGCPACSRVCPENAIMFPLHRTPAIAGAPASAADYKLDLSNLFGGMMAEESAEQLAAQERAQHLQAADRQLDDAPREVPKRREGKTLSPKDDLDRLIDSLDDLDL